jgi:hypothetical protein
MAELASSAVAAKSGLGTRCAEAQADGVPCPDLGVDCETCPGPAPALVVTPHRLPGSGCEPAQTPARGPHA